MAFAQKLYEPHELEGISEKDKQTLTRKIQQHISTDPVVRTMMILHKGVHDRPEDDPDPIVRALKHAGRGMKEHLKEKLQPLYDRMKKPKPRNRAKSGRK
jgi:hypothetical protein